ncbi:MAG TPA: sugar-binding domain-containing protein [Candidatus Limnocylindria bacterium]|nr:sugar-binding domain-containing protein [Candidatus Limnocylindria bacterium]
MAGDGATDPGLDAARLNGSGDEDMMRLVAELYYLRDRSQSTIAELTGFSVSKVSRLLAQARETGIVQISVQAAPDQLERVAAQLARALGIEDAHVTPARGDDPAAASRLCAVAAAPWVAETIPEAGVLGIAGGYTVSALVDALPPTRRSHLTIVPLVGGWDPATPHLDINELIRRAAERLECRYLLLHAPGRLDSGAVKEALMRESTIRATTEYWSRLSVGLIGIGGGPGDHPGYATVMDRVSERERRRLAGRRVAGDVVGYLVTIDGDLIDDPWGDHTIAAPVADLRRAARLVAVAAGPHKIPGIIGACRSGLVHSLVTDEPTARAILARLAATPVPRRPRSRPRSRASRAAPTR